MSEKKIKINSQLEMKPTEELEAELKDHEPPKIISFTERLKGIKNSIIGKFTSCKRCK